MTGARVLVTGSGRWTCWRTIMAALSLVWEPDAVLVTGACPEGAEELAARCWKHWGGQVERWPFDWDHDGGSVVSRWHWSMLKAGADVCLGFASTEGPTSLTTMARVVGVATYEWVAPEPTRRREAALSATVARRRRAGGIACAAGGRGSRGWQLCCCR